MNTKNLVVLLVAVFILVFHNDFWAWDKIDPLLFGWMPVGLWYQVIYHLLTALGMFLIIRLAWGEPKAGFFEAQDNNKSTEGKEV